MVVAAEVSGRALALGLLVGAAVVGFRHGLDRDHRAAVSDLTSSQSSPRRSMFLATLYACGHVGVVLAVGGAAIVGSVELPASIDSVMGRVVGAALITLGLATVVAVVREARRARLRNGWTVVIEALQRAVHSVMPRSRRAEPEAMVIEHEHEHEHDDAHAHPDEHLAPALAMVALHEHAHAPVPVAVPSGAGSTTRRHSHRHRHAVMMPVDPLPTHGAWGALGLGALHGVGAETPTQLVIFVWAVGVAALAGGWIALAVLGAFVIGLLAANTVVVAAAPSEVIASALRLRLYVALSVVAAACTVAIGALFVLERADLLRVVFSG